MIRTQTDDGFTVDMDARPEEVHVDPAKFVDELVSRNIGILSAEEQAALHTIRGCHA